MTDGAEELNMTRANRAIAAILLTVTTGALAMVDTTQAGAQATFSPAVAPLTYTVVAGDYLSGIAIRMGVKLSALLETNRLTLTSLIYPGTKLIVPPGGVVPTPKVATAPPTTTPTTTTALAVAAAVSAYTVRPGDSLSGIAGRMGVKLSALLAENKLTVASVIHPGAQLAVPAGGVLPSAGNPVVAPAAVTAVATVQYVVRSGDYLTGIAPALGVRVADLLSANKLTLTSVIYPGLKLTVPAGGRLPAATVTPAVAPAAIPSVAPAATSATPATTPAGGATTPDSRIATVIAFVQAQLGEPYKAFAAGPDSWDCSGLTMAAYAEIGISLQHYSGSQFTNGVAIDRATQPIVAGDLIFLESSVGSGIVSHVGIAISSTQWIHAPRTGDVVRIANIPSTRVIGIRRLLPAT